MLPLENGPLWEDKQVLKLAMNEKVIFAHPESIVSAAKAAEKVLSSCSRWG